MNSKQVNYRPEIRPNVQLINRYLWPRLHQMIIHVFVGIFNQFEIVKVIEKHFYCWVKSHFQIPKQRHKTNHADCFLKVWSSQLLIFLSMFFCHFYLLEITHSEQHPFFALYCSFKIKKIVILILVVRWVRHWVMNDLVFNDLWYLAFRVRKFNLSSSLVMEMNHWKTYESFIGFLITFFIHFFWHPWTTTANYQHLISLICFFHYNITHHITSRGWRKSL